MDRYTDTKTDIQMDRRLYGQTYRLTNVQMDRHIDRQAVTWTDIKIEIQ